MQMVRCRGMVSSGGRWKVTDAEIKLIWKEWTKEVFGLVYFYCFFCWQWFSPIATAPVGVGMLPGHPLWALFRVPRPRDPLGNSVVCKEQRPGPLWHRGS